LHAAEAIGVDIGGTRTRIALVAAGGILEGTLREFPTRQFSNGDELVGALAAHGADLGRGRVRGIGVSVPGLLCADFESVELCPNARMIEGYPLRARLREETGMRTALEVDCNAAALAESHFGAGANFRRVVVVSIGTGVGVGVVDGGSIVRITNGCSGDLGHIYVGGERRCSAGCRGCLEANVSVEALGGSGEEAASRVAALIHNARSGDLEAGAMLAKAGKAIGMAAASISSFLRPDLILLAGGISEAGDWLTASANEAFRDHASPSYLCPIRKARLGSNAALIGAAGSAPAENS